MRGGAKGALSSFIVSLKNLFARRNPSIDRQAELDKKLVYSLTKSRIPKFVQIKYLKKFLTSKELLMLRVSFLVILASLVFIGTRFYILHLKVTPARGGEYREAIVGLPRHINPIYAGLNDVDDDIIKLVYSSLMKFDGRGNLVDDLAESHEISADGKTYIFKLHKDAKWHSGGEVTADDVLFTFHLIKDAQFKSPLRSGLAGVEAEKIDEKTIRFNLAESYAPFLELMTFGILPENLWYQVAPEGAMLAELNIKPVGSGPYKFKSLSKDKNGQLLSYALEVNDDYFSDKPLIPTVTFRFFASDEEALDALNNNAVEGLARLPDRLKDSVKAKNSFLYHKLNFEQLTAVFFNKKNNPVLSDVKVRQALALAIDKDAIINEVFGGDARKIEGPILPENPFYNNEIKTYQINKDEAQKLLEDAGWKSAEINQSEIDALNQNKDKLKDADEDKIEMGAGRWRLKDKYLSVKLATAETDEYLRVAELIKKSWEAIGVKTTISTSPTNQIQPEVISPRNYEVLLYGEIVGNEADEYAFWHSSQISTNGANIANYANKEVDQLLEDGRVSLDAGERAEKYKRFQQIITDEAAAIFLYSPYYTYIQDKDVKGYRVENIQAPEDRLNMISGWYIKTKRKISW